MKIDLNLIYSFCDNKAKFKIWYKVYTLELTLAMHIMASKPTKLQVLPQKHALKAYVYMYRCSLHMHVHVVYMYM